MQFMQLFTAREVADRIGFSTKWIDLRRREGRIPALELPNGRFRYTERSVDAALSIVSGTERRELAQLRAYAQYLAEQEQKRREQLQLIYEEAAICKFCGDTQGFEPGCEYESIHKRSIQRVMSGKEPTPEEEAECQRLLIFMAGRLSGQRR